MSAEPVTLDAVERSFRGRIIRPQDAEYDAERALRNGLFDRHPADVVPPAESPG